MDIRKIPLGTKFDLELVNNIGERIGKIYVSQLLDIIDLSNIIISCPIHEARLTFIATGTKVRVTFFSDKYGLLSFLGSITEKMKTENILSFHTRIDSELEKIQRRNHFRLDCFLDGKYYVYPEVQAEEKKENEIDAKAFKKSLIKNVSGSGACIVTDEEIPGGSDIRLLIKLDIDIQIKVECKVIRCFLLEKAKDKKYETGLYFKEISQRDQDHLIKYIFKQQSQILKNNINDR